jgi:IclR family acetate operon transcriptional repressor
MWHMCHNALQDIKLEAGSVVASERQNSTAHMSSTLRTFEILEAVAQKQPIALSELAKLFSYSKSTIQRTLITLEAAGWLKQISSGNPQWEVTSRALLVRPRALEGGRFYAIARGPMTELRDKTNETIHLSILNSLHNMILIDRVDCDQAVRTFSPIGDVSPIHATSIGKAVLAYLPENEIGYVLSRPLERFTDQTVTDADALREELAEIRGRGYSVNLAEYRSTVCAIGAPIRNETGRAFAGICISAPQLRFDEDVIEEWGAWTAEAAAAISSSVGAT